MGTPHRTSDINFLCEVTSLPFEKVITLVEEDFDLILDSISENDFKSQPISFPLYTKLTIFRETKGVDFSIAEKAYVSDCVAEYYPKVHKRSHYALDLKSLSEADGQYYLVLVGMFPEFLIGKCSKNGAPNLSFYAGLAKNAFNASKHKTLANHIDDWIDLLYYIKKYCWN